MRRALLALPLLVLAGCVATVPETAPTRAPARADVVGRWAMEAIYDRGTDISADANPAGDRYIELRADGTFVSGGQPYGRNTGRWTYTPVGRELFLADDGDAVNDSRWVVSLRGPDRMDWSGTGSPEARRYRIVSVRVE